MRPAPLHFVVFVVVALVLAASRCGSSTGVSGASKKDASKKAIETTDGAGTGSEGITDEAIVAATPAANVAGAFLFECGPAEGETGAEGSVVYGCGVRDERTQAKRPGALVVKSASGRTAAGDAIPITPRDAPAASAWHVLFDVEAKLAAAAPTFEVVTELDGVAYTTSYAPPEPALDETPCELESLPKIDFEILDGVAVTGSLDLTNQVEPTHGVIFRSEGGDPVRIATFGPPLEAFQCATPSPCVTGADSLRPTYAGIFGKYFLADDGVSTKSTGIVMTFKKPVDSVRGIIFDLDTSEKMSVEGYDATLALVATAEYSGKTSGDGMPSEWVLDRSGLRDLVEVRIKLSSSGSAGYGLDDIIIRGCKK